MDIEPRFLQFVQDRFKTREMCEKAVEKVPCLLCYVPDHLKTQGMCGKAVDHNPLQLGYVPDHLKTKDMCEKVVEAGLSLLKYVPHWFVTHQQIKIWHDNDDYYNDDEFIEWYKAHQERKAQKASIKEGLLPIAWHPSRYWDCSMLEDEKQETKKLWG